MDGKGVSVNIPHCSSPSSPFFDSKVSNSLTIQDQNLIICRFRLQDVQHHIKRFGNLLLNTINSLRAYIITEGCLCI